MRVIHHRQIYILLKNYTIHMNRFPIVLEDPGIISMSSQLAETESLTATSIDEIKSLKKGDEKFTDEEFLKAAFIAEKENDSAVRALATQYADTHAKLTHCYRNDAFVVSYLFDLEGRRIHKHGVLMAQNAMAGYFEARTHGKFDLGGLLVHENLIASDTFPEMSSGYWGLNPTKIKAMGRKLDLPFSELQDVARNVLNHTFKNGYSVSNKESSWSSNLSIPLSQAEGLVREFILGSEYTKTLDDARSVTPPHMIQHSNRFLR
ncbi:MAG: hypothetical protein ACI8Y7_001194 [Candidatus Woesearchaeota archaeon]|jgi:hypothetical protein